MTKFASLWGRPAFIAKFHAGAAVAWFVFGLAGLITYILYLQKHPDPHAFLPVAASIPILFFISVYANVVGHWSSYQAAKVEVKQDQQIADVVSDGPDTPGS